MKFIAMIAAIIGFTSCTNSLWADCDASDETGRHAIHASAELAQPLMPGMMAPEFTVLDPAGTPVQFDPGQLDNPVVMTFYRGGWCPYCNLHLAEMRHVEEKVKEMGYDIWFISVDQPSVLEASLKEPDLEYRVLSDSDLVATRAFGIAFRLPDDLVDKYLEYDIDIEGASGRDHHVLPVPSTFIIGTDGVIKFAYSNPNYKVRLAPEILEAAASAHATDIDDRVRRS
jgi:peroxiredoxin